MVEDEDEIFFRPSWSRRILFLGFISISGQTNSKKKTKGWTKVIEVILLKQEENLICEEEKALLEILSTFFFPQEGI